MEKVALFASGSGSNAEALMSYFQDHPQIRVELLLSNKEGAYALTRAESFGISSGTFTRETFYQKETLREVLEAMGIRWIALAGFLWKLPPYLIAAYPDRILNIHPALLPKFGGKGMYGHHVHEAVVAAGETESGPTIHLVNEHYDEGQVLFQARTPVGPSDSPEDVAAKVLNLEHAWYPKVLEAHILGQPMPRA